MHKLSIGNNGNLIIIKNLIYTKYAFKSELL